jgi:hypothetical protein
MAEPKTKRTDASVDDFLAAVEPERRRTEGRRLLTICRDVTGEPGAMWGPTMVGFGSDPTGAWFKVGFSPRKAKLVVYMIDGFQDRGERLARLGPHSTGQACLYIPALDKVDEAVLRDLLHHSYTT